jgi:hypothetical protein
VFRQSLRRYVEQRDNPRVLIARVGGSTVRGALIHVLADAFVLAGAEAWQGQDGWRAVDGQLVVLREAVDYLQVLSGNEG